MKNQQSEDLKPLLEQAASNLIKTQVLSKGGKQPSPEAVEMFAKMLVAKGIREGKLNPLPNEAQSK